MPRPCQVCGPALRPQQPGVTGECAVQGILACLNVFSGSTFLSVGILHLLPHVTDYESMADLDTDFPVGLSLVVVGFLLVLFVEQVMFARDTPAGDGAGSTGSPEAGKSGDITGKEGSGRGGSVTDSEARGSIVEQTQALWQKYHSPLITEVAVVLHAVLESIVLGLTVRATASSLPLHTCICVQQHHVSCDATRLELQCAV